MGQYVVERKLGSGAIGDVYLARHALLRRPTALKLLREHRTDTQSLERFEREVQVTAAMIHPNIVAIYDYGRSDDGFFFYAMEYLDGMDLERFVTRFGPCPDARVIHILRQVCGSLGEAHARGLVHRDVKPSNVFLCRAAACPTWSRCSTSAWCGSPDRRRSRVGRACWERRRRWRPSCSNRPRTPASPATSTPSAASATTC